MKQIKIIPLFKFTVLLSLFLLFSCSKTEEIRSEYFGTWESKIGKVRSVFTFNENTYQTDTYYKTSDLDEYLYVTANGDLNVTQDTLHLVMNKVRTDTSFYHDYIPSGIMTEFIRGTPEFEEQFGASARYNLKYSINSDKLSIWQDSNIIEYYRIN